MEVAILGLFWGSLATQMAWYHRKEILNATSRLIKKSASYLWLSTKRLAKSAWKKRKRLFGRTLREIKSEAAQKNSKTDNENAPQPERKQQIGLTYKRHKTIKKQRYLKHVDPQAVGSFQEWVLEQRQIRLKKTTEEIEKERNHRLAIRWMHYEYLKPPPPEFYARCLKQLQRQEKELQLLFPKREGHRPYNPIVDRIEPSPLDVEVIQY